MSEKKFHKRTDQEYLEREFPDKKIQQRILKEMKRLNLTFQKWRSLHNQADPRYHERIIDPDGEYDKHRVPDRRPVHPKL